jgi:hypothetical protein
MERDRWLLLGFRLCVVASGALLVFVLLDVALAVTGVLTLDGTSLVRVVVCAVVGVLAALAALVVRRGRDELALGRLTFTEAILVSGLALVGGIVLLGALR